MRSRSPISFTVHAITAPTRLVDLVHQILVHLLPLLPEGGSAYRLHHRNRVAQIGGEQDATAERWPLLPQPVHDPVVEAVDGIPIRRLAPDPEWRRAPSRSAAGRLFTSTQTSRSPTSSRISLRRGTVSPFLSRALRASATVSWAMGPSPWYVGVVVNHDARRRWWREHPAPRHRHRASPHA